MSAAGSVPVILGDAVAIMTPLLFAALGGLFTELSGMLNIALEGLISIGAFFGAAACALTGSAAAGVLAAVAASVAAAALYGSVTIRLRANEFVTGLATNLLAFGLLALLSGRLFGTKGPFAFAMPELPRIAAESLRGLPFAGELLFRQDIFAWASWAAVPAAWALVARTAFGLRLRAAGQSPGSLVAQGLDPNRYRLAAALLSGAACGLAGASLSLGLGAYVPNIASGRGWIALVAIYLGGKRAGGAFAACFVFAAAQSFSNYAQGFLRVPSDFILALPYILTLAALILGAALRRRGRPG